MSSTTSPRTASSSVRPYVWVTGVLWLLPLVVVVTLYVVLPHHNPSGQCEGIGWGCTLTPADWVLLAGMVASPFLAVAGLVGCGVVAVVQAWRRRR